MREQKIVIKKENLLGYKFTQLKLYNEEKYKTLSEKTGYSKRSFSRYEKGECGINKTCVEGMAHVYSVTYDELIKFLTQKDFSIEDLFKLIPEKEVHSATHLNESGSNKAQKKLKIRRNIAIATIISSSCALIFLFIIFYLHLKDNVATYGAEKVDFMSYFFLVAVVIVIIALPGACVFISSVIREKIKNKKTSNELL